MKSLKMTHDKALETFKIFPYIAWGLVIGFSFFVYSLTIRLEDNIDQLGKQTKFLEEKASSPIKAVDDFEN